MTEILEIIQPSGILDSAKTQDLRDQINQSLEQGASTILVDLQSVTFMDSSGLGALVTSLKTVRASGGRLCVCAINDQVKILFELTSMDRVFEIFKDRDHFLQQRALSLSVPS